MYRAERRWGGRAVEGRRWELGELDVLVAVVWNGVGVSRMRRVPCSGASVLQVGDGVGGRS